MPVPPYRARRDKSEPDIVQAFRDAGWSVVSLNAKGVPDLLTGPCTGPIVLVECKTNTATLTDEQTDWHRKHAGWPVYIVRTPAQARRLIRQVEDARRTEIAEAVEWYGGGPDGAVEDGEDRELEALRRCKGEEPA